MPRHAGRALSATSLTLTTTPLAVSSGGTGTATAFTAGSLVFAGASGTYTQNNTRVFWDQRLTGKLFTYAEAGTQLRYDSGAGDAQLTTPLQLILNWLPTERWTLYVPVSAAPDWVGAE